MGRNIESDKNSIRRSRQPRSNPRIRRRSAVGTLLACIGVTRAHEQKSAPTSLGQFRNTVSKWLDDAGFPSSGAGLYTLRFAIEGAPNEEVMHALRVATTPGQMIFATDAGRTVVLGLKSERVQCIRRNTDEYVRSICATQDNYDKTSNAGFCWEISKTTNSRLSITELAPALRDAIVARWCASIGRRGDAELLWQRAFRSLPQYFVTDNEIEQFEQSFVLTLLERTIASMASPNTSRIDCIEQLDWLLSISPDGQVSEYASKCRAALFNSHEVARKLDIPKGTPFTGVDLSLHQLLDLTSNENDQGNGLFFAPEALSSVPIQQLVSAGKASIDALRKQLDNQLPTRCVCESHDSITAIRWITLGEVAQTIINWIEFQRDHKPAP